MFSLEIECEPDEKDFLIAELWEQGPAGIVELNPRVVRAFFEDTVSRSALLGMYPGSRLRVEEDRDWVQASRDLLQPMAVGERFYLAPVWRDDPTPAGRLRISVNPGMAFGTGAHESTQLCLEALETYLAPGMTVLDIGTGTGILAEAARLLGAGKVYACDVDPVAVEIAGAWEHPPLRFLGSADAVRAQSADVVLANLNPGIIARLIPHLLAARREGGVLLASGIESHELGGLQEKMPPPRELRQKGDWALIAF
ncbi:MAG TPA: 50S ribosomal protein L11 methyltransferase [Bryobacteraceae bacterium]|nr:50S ribosomal protein L11 methyltransferase [Bryobacteraceae bacterium]